MNLKKITTVVVGSAAAVTMFAGSATAAVTVDAATGTGFIGKGDVQLALGLSNAELQKQAGAIAGEFTSVATSASETSWTCTRTLNNGNIQTQERERTTTTTTTGVVTAVARDGKKQFTGFIASGYSSSSSSTSTEGPAQGSCPNGGVPSDLMTEPLGSSTVVSVRGVAMVEPAV